MLRNIGIILSPLRGFVGAAVAFIYHTAVPTEPENGYGAGISLAEEVEWKNKPAPEGRQYGRKKMSMNKSLIEATVL
jgi:hypothetical protein